MQQLHSADTLKANIQELERKRAQEERMIRERLHTTYDNIKPTNLIKNSFKEATSLGAKDKMINTTVGLTAGLLAKMLFQRVAPGPFKKLLGSVIQLGVTNLIVQNPTEVKTAVLVISNVLKSWSEIRRKRRQVSEAEETA